MEPPKIGDGVLGLSSGGLKGELDFFSPVASARAATQRDDEHLDEREATACAGAARMRDASVIISGR